MRKHGCDMPAQEHDPVALEQTARDVLPSNPFTIAICWRCGGEICSEDIGAHHSKTCESDPSHETTEKPIATPTDVPQYVARSFAADRSAAK